MVSKILSNFLLFCTYSSGLVTLAMPGLSCWGVVVSAPRSERVDFIGNRPLTVLQGWPRLENRRKDVRDIRRHDGVPPFLDRLCFVPIPVIHALIQLDMPPTPDPQQRQDISSRLDSLVKDSSAMPPRRLSIVRGQSVSAPASPVPRLKHLAEDAQQPASTSQSSSGPSPPILRWFRTQISLPPPPPPSRPQSPHSAALSEAMHDHLLAGPEPVHLPPQYHANIRPPMLNELTRSTLPISSLAAPQLTDSHVDRLGHHTPDSSRLLLSNRIPPSAPARTSLDTLRTLYTKAIPTHQQTRSITIPTPFRNWFQAEPVKDNDEHKSILTEEDQHEDPEAEREYIRKKCKCPPDLLHRLSSVERPSRSFSEEPCCILPWPSWLRLCHHRTSHCSTRGHSLARA